MTHEFNTTMPTPGEYHLICPDCGRWIIKRDVEGEEPSVVIKNKGDNSIAHPGGMGPVYVGVQAEKPGALDDVCDKLFSKAPQ